MAKFVRVRHKETGDVASLPESALPNLPDWEPVDGPAPDKAKPKKNLPSQPTHAAPAASTEME
jgi:hypothetical protein